MTELLPIEDFSRRVHACSEAATASGALVPWATRVHTVEDGGLEFAVRVSANVARKEAAATGAETRSDPFAPPYDPELYVGDISATHVALLNKYNVLP
ncbi:MAG: phosphorylase, partial [Gammaproteobacteria bacterium]|nr:phosphorylase [Gammaproteobacteria bacterium]